MPSLRKSSPPPPVMTWGKAIPVLVVAVIFDALRLMFEMFWFFGPALSGVICAAKVSGAIGTTAGSLLCGAGAGVVGYFASPVLIAFGVVMAMATGFAGWSVVGGYLMMTNARIYKENTLLFVASLAICEVPFIGSIPAISAAVWRMHSVQIRVERAAYKKWEKEQAAAQLLERRQQEAQLMQFQATEFSRQEQALQQEELATEEAEQQKAGNGETSQDKEISEVTVPAPIQVRSAPMRVGQSEPNLWSPNRGTPPPLTPEYGWRETPPPLPAQAVSVPPPLPVENTRSYPPPLPMPIPSRSIPPPLPGQARAMPPPLPAPVQNYTSTQPPPLPKQSISGMKERPGMTTDERSVEQVTLRNNAFIVHTIAESGDVQHHNENSNVSGKATYGDDMDIMLAFEPSVSASSVTPGKKAQLWTGDGFILGGGQISEAGGSDQGTIAHGIKRRGNKTSSLEEIDEVVGRNKDWHDKAYEKHGTFGMNELVVNNSEVFGFFQQAEKDESGRYWAFSTGTRKESEIAKRMRRYGPTTFDKIMENYRRRFATAQERGIPLFIMTPDREVYEYLGANDDGTVEVGKQLTPEEVAKGRAGLSVEKRKEIGEKILEKKIFREEKTQKEAEEIIKSL